MNDYRPRDWRRYRDDLHRRIDSQALVIAMFFVGYTENEDPNTVIPHTAIVRIRRLRRLHDLGMATIKQVKNA